MANTVFLLRIERRHRTAERICFSSRTLDSHLDKAVEAMARRNRVDPDDLVERTRFLGDAAIYGETRCGDDRVVWSRVVSEPRAA